MRRSSLFAASLLAALAGTAHAQDRVQVGVLECRGGASIGFVVGSVTNLGCLLRIEGMPEDRYVAFMIGFGYPADRPLRPIKKPTRRPFDEVIHHERW